MVPRDHDDADAGLAAFGDRLRDFSVRGVHHGHESQEGQSGFDCAHFDTSGLVTHLAHRDGEYAVGLSGEGPTLTLSWPKPQKISRIQLTFDSGFQRELMLTPSDSHTRGTVRAAQPETVRDYVVSVKNGSGFQPVAEVKGNHQRQNRHRFAPVETDSVQIRVTATNGLEEARIIEVRCYA